MALLTEIDIAHKIGRKEWTMATAIPTTECLCGGRREKKVESDGLMKAGYDFH